ncbi:MAG: hypothetical protein IPM79_13530 [Polyangiaceae bacterium]|nr:hypothetical protein [Polyangiaceae bacterium]
MSATLPASAAAFVIGSQARSGSAVTASPLKGAIAASPGGLVGSPRG